MLPLPQVTVPLSFVTIESNSINEYCIEIDEESQMARIKNLRTEVLQTKTLHWCRKNLIKD